MRKTPVLLIERERRNTPLPFHWEPVAPFEVLASIVNPERPRHAVTKPTCPPPLRTHTTTHPG